MEGNRESTSVSEGGNLDMCKAITDLIEDGRKEGENTLANLIVKLSSLGKNDDIVKVSTDEAYREQLYIQYGLKKAEKEAL